MHDLSVKRGGGGADSDHMWIRPCNCWYQNKNNVAFFFFFFFLIYLFFFKHRFFFFFILSSYSTLQSYVFFPFQQYPVWCFDLLFSCFHWPSFRFFISSSRRAFTFNIFCFNNSHSHPTLDL